MATSIPYHPSLSLGDIVNPVVLQKLLQISDLRASINAAQDKLNSFVSMRRSMEITIQELMNMNIDPTQLIQNNANIATSILQAATAYADVRMKQEAQIQELKASLSTTNIQADWESPVDYNRTQIKELPLAAESLKMDVQYFSYNQNGRSADTTIASIKDFINESTSILGDAISNKIGTDAVSQINNQKENHDLAGTLIITASCTHKNAIILYPLILDIDKTIELWNQIFSADEDKIKTNDITALKLSVLKGTGSDRTISILSGANYGSSFVGMVHLLRRESTEMLPSSIIEHIQEQFTLGKWFAKESGSFGVDPSFVRNIKNLLSTQNITSHVNVITMGVIPSVKSNEVRTSVKTLADVDAAKAISDLTVITNATDNTSTISSSATVAQTGAEMLSIKGAAIENVILSLSKIDNSVNQTLDIQSLMTAFEDYITKVSEGKAGVPVSYYIKNINRAQLAQLWLNKYYNNQNSSISENNGDNYSDESSKGS